MVTTSISNTQQLEVGNLDSLDHHQHHHCFNPLLHPNDEAGYDSPSDDSDLDLTITPRQNRDDQNNHNNTRESSPANSIRSLISTRPLSTSSIMSTTSFDQIPSTPSLSRSTSTRDSASFRSMPSTEDMQSVDLHFEDISLDSNSLSYVSKPRPTLRSTQTTTAIPRRSSEFMGSHKGLRITASHNAARSRNSWTPSDIQSSSPVISSGRRTPSPSKSPNMSVTSSPRSASSTPRIGNENSPIFPSSRPQSTSWLRTPRRKSAKEIEADFHDSDDELPEDSFLFNIPLSPRPLGERAPGTPLPRHPAAHRLSRTSSWQAALQDLTEDTKKLTAALELHSDITTSSPISNRATSPNSSTTSTPTSRNSSKARPSLKKSTTVAVLPPLQKSNPLIDPLPCSKEKELVLSRTRPSWLPPKEKKEEIRHLKEYQMMMRKIAMEG